MKPIIIYPSKEDEDAITIKKSYLESIIEQAYQQGLSDGNCYGKPVYRSTTPLTNKGPSDNSTYSADSNELTKILREIFLDDIKSGKDGALTTITWF